jgi:S1-C subfamily serine protease
MCRYLITLVLLLLMFPGCGQSVDRPAEPVVKQDAPAVSVEPAAELPPQRVDIETSENSASEPMEVAAAPPEPSPLPTPEELYAAATPAVALLHIKGKDGTDIGLGTGFFIDDVGTLITNAHVVFAPGAMFIVARVGEDAAYFIEHVQCFDIPMDLAVLKVPVKNVAHLAVADAMPAVGSRAYVVGNPVGLRHTLSEGLVSGLRRINDSHHEVIQTTAAISKGSSGSPLLNESGQVIGVATFFVNQGQNLNFAVPVSGLQELLNKERANHPVRFYSFIEKFKLENAAWMYAANGKTLTAQGQAFVGAIDSLKTKGISDPEQLAKEGLKIAGIQGTLPTKTRTAQTAKQNSDSLQAIKALRVLVQTPDADARALGLKAADLQTMVELKLRTAGMNLVSTEEWKTIPRSAYIVVRVSISGATDPFAYVVELMLKQATIVRIDSTENHIDLRTAATTWEASTRCGTATRQSVNLAVRDAINASLDEFQNAYLGANPRQSARSIER